MAFERTIPEIELVEDPTVRAALEAIKEIIETREELRGDPLDAYITKRVLSQQQRAVALKTSTFSGTAGAGTFAKTGLIVGITPTSVDAIIFLSGRATIGVNTGVSVGVYWKFVRREDGVDVSLGDAAGSRTRATGHSSISNSSQISSAPLLAIDSPKTLKPVTYELEIGAVASTNVYLNRSHNDTDAAGHSRTSSILIADEYKLLPVQNLA